MHQQYAEQIRCGVVVLFFCFFWHQRTKQHHKEEWNQCVVLTHLSPRGSQEDTSRRRREVCVCLWMCNGVINCMHVCVYSQSNKDAYPQHLAIHRKTGWLVCHICTVCAMGGGVSARCCFAWNASLSGCVRFPRRLQVLVASEPGLHRAWLKDTPLISPVGESVNLLQSTSSGPADWQPSVIT